MSPIFKSKSFLDFGFEKPRFARSFFIFLLDASNPIQGTGG